MTSIKFNQLTLLNKRYFLPLFITQFLGAFHDNLFKNAFIIYVLYGLGSKNVENPEFLVTIATGIFIFPFIIFSGIGGQLADKFSKNRIIYFVKIAEVFIAFIGAIAIISGAVYLALFTLFILGTQSAFFGPSKYSILPQHLKPHELIGGNALLNTGSFLAILCGTILGTILITLNNGAYFVAISLFVCALIGLLASKKIPTAKSFIPHLLINYNPITETFYILKKSLSQGLRVKKSILGVGWFYGIGSMFISQMPNFTENTLNANPYVLMFLFIIFSLGISVGGLINNTLLKSKINTRYIFIASIGITIFSIDLYLSNLGLPAQDPRVITIFDFISHIKNWRVIFDIAMISVCGGLFVVPLTTIIQYSSEEKIRARIIAGSAIINALFVVGASIFSGFLILKGFEIHSLFFIFALINIIAILYLRNIPQHQPNKY